MCFRLMFRRPAFCATTRWLLASQTRVWDCGEEREAAGGEEAGERRRNEKIWREMGGEERREDRGQRRRELTSVP